jgi:acyl-CoA synthetase (AMP-forming)/AMP-acid ligase II
MSILDTLTLENYERDFASRHLIHGAPAHWAAEDPEGLAIINASRGTTLTWAQLDHLSTAVAWHLLHAGFRKGDFFATSLPFLTEHIVLEYGCFKAGVIHAPLDLRLPVAEVIRSLTQIRARGFAFLGPTPMADFRELGKAVQQMCPFVETLVQFSEEDPIPGARSAREFLAPPAPAALPQIAPTDGAQVIFTTGSTGSPKAALLSHRAITAQNLCLGSAFGFGRNKRTLVNLPPSHVGGQSELLMSTLFMGGTAVVLEIFDAAKSIAAIEQHRVTLLGQIPAMFAMEWRLGSYAQADLSSLEIAVYGGQAVSRQFLEQLARTAPAIGTGLGLTETAGFCTYTLPGATVDDLAASIGYAAPLYPLSIREPMQADGSAGAELAPGASGHVCFRGPQNFSGYVNDPAATAACLSTDGWLYTGDIGTCDERGLHFQGRAKFILKPAGYQVFPGDIEAAVNSLSSKVANCGVTAAPHEIRTDGIIAFVERRAEAELSEDELRNHTRDLPPYMRPLAYVILDPGALPLNRSAKIDYLRLNQMAREEAEKLRAQRKWDR